MKSTVHLEERYGQSGVRLQLQLCCIIFERVINDDEASCIPYACSHATKKNDATLTVGMVYLHRFIFCETACTLSSKMQVMMFNFSRRVSQCSSSHLESIFYPLLISLLSVTTVL